MPAVCVGGHTERAPRHAERGYRTNGNSQRSEQRFAKLSTSNGFEVRTQHLDQILSFHDRLLRLISCDKAFNPRCTDTFTADGDIPVRAAVSLTLNPSSFMWRMTC
jgi:hypothetical protein